MKLFITPGSPYARIVRVVLLEKGVGDRVELVVVKTREAGSPYYAINPSGRVPYLMLDDGSALEDSAVICSWVDRHLGERMFDWPAGDGEWAVRGLEGAARGMLDGLSVWLRESYRPVGERSPGVVQHERDRARRLADVWEAGVANPWMNGALNLAQIALACALGLEARNPDFQWRAGRPRLCDWYERISARPSFVETAPPDVR